MPIEGAKNFTYIGYTEAEDNKGKPTLYFKEGRYTQFHRITENIGWHPAKGDRYRAENITEDGVKEFDKAEATKNSSMLYAFCEKFRKGTYDAKPNDPKSLYFECWDLPDNRFSYHISRSRLVRPTDQYSEAYAKDILAKGELAPNEKSSKKMRGIEFVEKRANV
ncbi:hypothetical protein WSM22_37150 [Cytophagales bacterium WSM2-2]|nr:hypothetical protein WSM22_37150 [Cytophagales bacterium WSM2-2]